MAAKSNKSYIILHVMSACVAVQDKHQLDRIFELEAQMSNLTSTVTALSQNIESANTKVPCLQFATVSVSKCPVSQCCESGTLILDLDSDQSKSN